MEDKELMKYVGNRIKEERIKKNLTQKELGKLIGVAHNTISTYESGRNAPEQNAIFKIARALDIKVDDFFPPTGTEPALHRLEELGETDLNVEEMAFLQELIKKTLSMDKEERDRFLDRIKFEVEYYDKNKN